MSEKNSESEVARQLAGNAGDLVEQLQNTALLISEQDAAERLGISTRNLWNIRKKNAVPSTSIGRRVLYPVAGLTAWIDAGCPTDENAADRLEWRGGAA